ncbi:TetR/AcrR family transcriptional regulator [Portibacter lacus]|uniref:TetR family transcriptional regulator n=1 Tax=Portibacter lacus TaxID=1099794 RepID=A0AA37SSX9_9BACT|nr:TetR/AcrR family transcriptional regulator [Portibacter lacus]GLR17480.1 TetR family transcriptional regulator [Portibacter lacus]
MRNPELTRLTILEKSSILFNTQGYKATSLSDICKASKLTKGAIYKNFKDKSELEKEALLFMSTKLLTDVADRISEAPDAENKLYAILKYFENYHACPPFEGGCPLMNASIEADDSNAELKSVVKHVMNLMHEHLCRVIRNGIKHGQVKEDTDISGLSSIIISSLEGSVMMLKVMDTNKHMMATSKFLKSEIARNLI